MAEVPYVPFQTVQSTGQSMMQQSVPNATPEAFGYAVGIAMQHLGATVEQAGQVAGQRVVEFQHLDNEVNANNMSMDAMQKMGEESNKFYAMDGKAAMDYLPTYMQNIQKIRQDAIAGAGNPEVQRMLSLELTRRAGFLLVDGGKHAAQQGKAALNESRNASISLAQSDAAKADDDQFQSLLGTIEQNTIAQLKDQHVEEGSDIWKKAIQDAKGSAWMNRIEMIGRVDPFRAKQLVEKNIDQMNGEQFSKATAFINTQAAAVGSRKIADATAPVTQDQNALRGAIKSVESGDYNATGPGVRLKFDGGASVHHAIGAYQIMDFNVPSWTKEVLGKSMTPEEFRNDPAAQDKVFDAKFGDMVKKYGLEGAASMWLTGSANPGTHPEGDHFTPTNTYVAKFMTALRGYGMSSKDNPNIPNAYTAKDEEAWVQRARQQAEEQFPGNTVVADQAEARVRAQVNAQNSMSKQFQSNVFNVVRNAVLFRDAQGNKITDLQQTIQNDPKFAAAWGMMNPDDQEKIYKIVAENAKGTEYHWNADRLARYQYLKGLYYTDPDRFRNEKLLQEQLPDRELKELADLQVKPLKNDDADRLGITHAMSVINATGLLQQAGIDMKADPDRHALFVGSVVQLLKKYAEENPRSTTMPDDKIYQAIPELIKQVPVQGSDNKTPHWYSWLNPGNWGGGPETAAAFEAGRTPTGSPTVKPGAVDAAYMKGLTADQVLMKQGVPMLGIQQIKQDYYQRFRSVPSPEDILKLYWASPFYMKKYPPVGGMPRSSPSLEGIPAPRKQ